MTHHRVRFLNSRIVLMSVLTALSVLLSPSLEAFAVSTTDTITGVVTYDSTITVEAGDVLRFDPAHDTTMEISGNLVVEGTLEMKPEPGISHTLRFVGVDESAFVGGGMEVLESDRGLWVVGSGRLDLVGEEKKGWNRTGTDPTWHGSDELVIAPTAVGQYGVDGFESFTLGSTVPQVDDSLPPAEVLNLTRTARIEGTVGGRSHVTIMSSVPQVVRFVAFRHMGPRQPTEDASEGVTGRYPLHFHMNGEGSRGSIVEGNVIRDSGNRAIVPHGSDGIAVIDNVAYDVFDTPYWWDLGQGDATDDTTWTHNFAGYVRSDPAFRGFENSGFQLGLGDGNVAIDNAAAGIQGNKNCSGFTWPSQGSGLWEFANNVSHNNKCHGIFVWQNNAENHHIDEFVAYRNQDSGINHGAYANDYIYTNLYLFENGEAGIFDHAFAKPDAPGRTHQTWACVTVVNSPVAVRILPSNSSEEGTNPALFDYLTTVNTPVLFEVDQAALDQGQTIDRRAEFTHVNVPCPAGGPTIPGGDSGRFLDDDGNIHEANIEIIAAAGITLGCNPPTNDRYCPSAPVSRAQMATFLVRAFDLPPATGGDRFVDDDNSIHEPDIEALAAAGVTLGCNPPSNTRYCPGATIDRAQMATFLVRALGLPPSGSSTFSDDDGSVHEADIQALAAAGITLGCNPPQNTMFCPDSPVLRDQMASFLARAISLSP